MDYKPLTMSPEVSRALSGWPYLKEATLQRIRLKSERELSEIENTETHKACDIGCYAGAGCSHAGILGTKIRLMSDNMAKDALRLHDAETQISRLSREREGARVEIDELKKDKLAAHSEIAYLIQKMVVLEKPTIDAVAEPITECNCIDLKSQIESLKLQLAAEKRISQKYARDLQQRDNQQATLTAM